MASDADGRADPAVHDWLTPALAGDPDAFCQLAVQHQERLLRQACGLSGNPAIAEDLAAETIIEAWRSLARYDRSCRFSTWLFSILLHRYQKHLRRARSRPVPMSGLTVGDASEREGLHLRLPDASASPSEQVAQAETRLLLRRAIELLPDKHREVLLLRFFEDASLEDIAVALKCSVGTVKSRLHYALEKLRAGHNRLNLETLFRDT